MIVTWRLICRYACHLVCLRCFFRIKCLWALDFLPPHTCLLSVATTQLYASAPFPGNIKSGWCPIFSFYASCHFRSPSLSSLLGRVGFLKSVAFLQQSIILCNYSPITDPCSFSLETRHAPLMGRCIRSLSRNLAICRSKLQSTFTEGHNLRYLCFFSYDSWPLWALPANRDWALLSSGLLLWLP